MRRPRGTRPLAVEGHLQVLDQQRLADLEQLTQQQARQETLASDVVRSCESIGSVLESPKPEERQQALRLILDYLLVGQEQLIIKRTIPRTGDRR